MASKTASAWAKPESTPAPEPAREPLVVVSSGAVAEDRWAKELPTSPRGFAKLAFENDCTVVVYAAIAKNVDTEVRSWRVTVAQKRTATYGVVVWEQHSGEAPESKKKCHIGTAYMLTDEGLKKTNVTTIKNAIKGGK